MISASDNPGTTIAGDTTILPGLWPFHLILGTKWEVYRVNSERTNFRVYLREYIVLREGAGSWEQYLRPLRSNYIALRIGNQKVRYVLSGDRILEPIQIQGTKRDVKEQLIAVGIKPDDVSFI